MDAFIKIWQKGKGINRLKSFYTGGAYYSLAYVVFVSLQFAIHDMLIESISEFTGSRSTSILHFLRLDESEEVK